uniref:(northern house mosquito) hypothetical protein n=2 Tax=Culex pipiens TaxID=7175 RepID=A0A8D8E2H0_CULPI
MRLIPASAIAWLPGSASSGMPEATVASASGAFAPPSEVRSTWRPLRTATPLDSPGVSRRTGSVPLRRQLRHVLRRTAPARFRSPAAGTCPRGHAAGPSTSPRARDSPGGRFPSGSPRTGPGGKASPFHAL